MKQYTMIFNKTVWAMLALLMMTFVACSDDDDNNVVLEAFGPSPALRGGQISFIGRNLDRVNTIVFPDGIEVTDIEKLSDGTIKATVPQTAVEGQVILRGNGFEIVSVSKLTYTEDIEIESISPLTVKAGDVLTIKGEYLNLITRVIFTDGVEVSSEDFVEGQSRESLQVIVPQAAQTGIITLVYDQETSSVELESEEIITVVLPSVATVADLSNAKPGDEISIEVDDIDLVEAVQLPNDITVEFAVNNNTLTFTLPSGAANGTVYAVAYSGVKVPIATLGVAVPTNLSVSPATGLRSGDVITITGQDMDLVTSVAFPNVSDAVALESQSSTSITVKMPELAQSGEITLNTASGNSVSATIETLKPTASTYTPTSVEIGSELTIAGSNLDLVATVTIGGTEITPSAIEASSLVLMIPISLETGSLEVVLNMNNGEQASASNITITKPSSCYIVSLPSEAYAGELLSVQVENASYLNEVQIAGTAVQYILQGSTLYIPFESNLAGATVELKLVSSNGTITYSIKVVTSGEAVTTALWTGSAVMPSDWSGNIQMTDDAAKAIFATAKVGDVVRVTIADVSSGAQGSFKNGNWSQIADGTDYFDISGDYYELNITQEILDSLISGGLIVSGHSYTATGVYLLSL